MATYVLIHGGGGSAWDWHLVVPQLRDRGHEVVAVDLPNEDPSAGWSEYVDTVEAAIRESLGAPWDQASMILGVGPVLVRNGQVDVTAQAEQFPGDIAYGRAPRTAVGIMPNGHILLAVVDGRQASSIGCTLTEMGELMKKFGASDALNFDGGGSSEMILGGRILNNPSDGAERPLGCALVVVKK